MGVALDLNNGDQWCLKNDNISHKPDVNLVLKPQSCHWAAKKTEIENCNDISISRKVKSKWLKTISNMGNYRKKY